MSYSPPEGRRDRLEDHVRRYRQVYVLYRGAQRLRDRGDSGEISVTREAREGRLYCVSTCFSMRRHCGRGRTTNKLGRCRVSGAWIPLTDIVPSVMMSHRCRLVNEEYGGCGGVRSVLADPAFELDSGSGSGSVCVCETSEVSFSSLCSCDEVMDVHGRPSLERSCLYRLCGCLRAVLQIDPTIWQSESFSSELRTPDAPTPDAKSARHGEDFVVRSVGMVSALSPPGWLEAVRERFST